MSCKAEISARGGASRRSPQASISVPSTEKCSSESRRDRRSPDKQPLIEEVAAWEQERNANNTKSDWHFTT